MLLSFAGCGEIEFARCQLVFAGETNGNYQHSTVNLYFCLISKYMYSCVLRVWIGMVCHEMYVVNRNKMETVLAMER